MIFCDRAWPSPVLWYICIASVARIRSPYAFLWGCKVALAALVLFHICWQQAGSKSPRRTPE